MYGVLERYTRTTGNTMQLEKTKRKESVALAASHEEAISSRRKKNAPKHRDIVGGLLWSFVFVGLFGPDDWSVFLTANIAGTKTFMFVALSVWLFLSAGKMCDSILIVLANWRFALIIFPYKKLIKFNESKIFFFLLTMVFS